MADLDLTPNEMRVLRASSDFAATIRRRRMAAVTGGVMLAVIVGAALVPVSRDLLLVAFAVYVALVIFERVSYANSVLAYKSLIRKLLTQVDIDRPDENAV